jgi:hypothetical protein
MGDQSRRDLRMAVQAAERGFATAELVAGGALSGCVETPMRPRKRARRHLPERRRTSSQQ